MSFNDIFKNSFLNKFNNEALTTTTIVLTLGMALLIGLFVFFVYRVNSNSGFYNRSYNKSLAVLPVITAAIILAMGSNLAISLGMVGALSIVRFRNAIKDTLDLTFLFWSISIGIVVGAGLFELAIILSLVVALFISIIDLMPVFSSPCILVVSGERGVSESKLLELINQHTKKVKIRSRNICENGAEWIFEMKTKNEELLIRNISKLEKVTSVHLMTHDGDVRF